MGDGWHLFKGDAYSKVIFNYYLTNLEASTVVKKAGSGRARKKCRGKHEMKLSVSPYFLSALPLPKLL